MSSSVVDHRISLLMAQVLRACLAIALLVLGCRSLAWPGFDVDPTRPDMVWLLLVLMLPLLLSIWHRVCTEVRTITLMMVATSITVMGMTIARATLTHNLTWWHLPLQGMLLGGTGAALGLAAPARDKRGLTRPEAAWLGLLLAYLAVLWVVGLLNPAQPLQEAHWLARQTCAGMLTAACVWLLIHDLRQGLGDLERRIRLARWAGVGIGLACLVLCLVSPWLQDHSRHRVVGMSGVLYGAAALVVAAGSWHVRWRHHAPPALVVIGLSFLLTTPHADPGLALMMASVPAVCLPLLAVRQHYKAVVLLTVLALAGLTVVAWHAQIEPVHVFMNSAVAALLCVTTLWMRLRADLLASAAASHALSPQHAGPADDASTSGTDDRTRPPQAAQVRTAARWAVSVFVLSSAASLWGAWIYGENADRMRTTIFQTEVNRQADGLIEAIVDVQFRAHALFASIGESTPTAQHFDRIASTLYRGLGPGDSLGWAPYGVVTYMYPLDGNEAAIGHNLLTDPRRRDAVLAMIDSREPAWDGPYPLRQGGLGLLYRIPEFGTGRGSDPQHPGTFSGITTALMRLPGSLSKLLTAETSAAGPMRVWIGSSPEHMVLLTPEAAHPEAQPASAAAVPVRHITATRVLKPFASGGAPLSRAWTEQAPPLPGLLYLRVEAQARHPDLSTWAEYANRIQACLMASALLSWLTLLLVQRNLEFAEVRARHKEAQDLHRLLSASMSGMLLYNAAGQCARFNEAALSLFGHGHTPGTEPGNFWTDAEFQARGWVAEARATMDDGHTRDMFYVGATPCGRAVHTHMRFHRLQYGGEPYLLVQGSDQSELFAKESALQATRVERDLLEQRLSTLYQHAKVGLALFEGSRIVWINDGARTLLGREPESMIGQSTQAFFASEAEWAEYGQRSKATLASGELFEGEVRCRRADGALRWMYSSVQVADPTQRPWRIAGVFLDITERHEMEQRLRLAQVAAEQADQAKSRFVSNMSHEMRTPLNALLGYARLLGRSRLSPEQTAQVARIELAAASLLRLVNDVLDFSRIEAGEFKLNPEPTDLGGLIDGVGQLMRVLALDKGLQLLVDPLPATLRTVVQVDGARLRQVLVNLLGNAIKFTERGQVRLTARHVGTPDKDRLRLEFTVQDSGPGMSSELQARIFQRFSQGDDSASRQHGGTGLGLAIVREIMQAMQGDVSVHSRLGQGSTFTVTLDVERSKMPALAAEPRALPGSGPTPHPPQPSRRLAELRLLVVDDSELNRDVAQSLLSAEGAQVHTCNDGQQAVDWLRNPDHTVDAVLMDLQMPGMDGYTAVALLRREARLTPLPFIALSADVSTEAAAAARQAGLCAFVGKPFDPESLASVTLREVARARGLASPPVTAAPIAAVTTDPPPPSPAWPALPGIDIPQAQRQSRQDPDRFRRYLQQLLQQFSALREASALPEDAAGRAQVLAQCHKLAGSAGIVGALALGELARRAERAGRQDDWPQVQAGLEDIALALSALAEAASRLNTE